jgi:hypothetical protein
MRKQLNREKINTKTEQKKIEKITLLNKNNN